MVEFRGYDAKDFAQRQAVLQDAFHATGTSYEQTLGRLMGLGRPLPLVFALDDDRTFLSWLVDSLIGTSLGTEASGFTAHLISRPLKTAPDNAP